MPAHKRVRQPARAVRGGVMALGLALAIAIKGMAGTDLLVAP